VSAGVPFSRPSFHGGEADALAEVVASGWVAQGPRVRAFEEAFARRVGTRDAVATSSGTSALELTLYALGVGPGDEVIVPSLSFIATANAVWHVGATPVFADIDPATYNLDPSAAEAAISAQTKAVMPVHQIGLAADMDAFADVARRHGLLLVEDAAPALGARVGERQVGSLDNPACFSLHARKVITTGEGGMVTTDDHELAERLRRLRHHGMELSDIARHGARDVVFETYGERAWNARMSDLQAAVGLSQLEALDEFLARRRRIAERYATALERIPHLEAPIEPAGFTHSWQSYAVRVLESSPIDRTELMRRLLNDDIATRRGVTAIHCQAPYRDAATEPLPHSERAQEDVILLPMFADLAPEQQERVIERLAAHVLQRAA
jgi:perosamine synthetase